MKATMMTFRWSRFVWSFEVPRWLDFGRLGRIAWARKGDVQSGAWRWRIGRLWVSDILWGHKALGEAGRKLARLQAAPCAFCEGAVQGNYAIHRDGLGEGPELPLCDGCGQDETPTCEEIWAKIAANRQAHTIPSR